MEFITNLYKKLIDTVFDNNSQSIQIKNKCPICTGKCSKYCECRCHYHVI